MGRPHLGQKPEVRSDLSLRRASIFFSIASTVSGAAVEFDERLVLSRLSSGFLDPDFAHMILLVEFLLNDAGSQGNCPNPTGSFAK
jgi:hypothetical protein